MEITTAYKIMKVQYPEFIRAIGHLRYEAWIPVYGVEKTYFGNETWQDDTDTIASHWVVFNDDQLIASARVSIYDDVTHLPCYDRMPEEAIVAVQLPAAYLSRMVVHPDYRKQGLSKIMDETRIAFIREQKVKTIVGEPVNSRLQRFKDYGFEFYDLLHNMPELPGVPLHLMVRNLTY